MAFEYFVVDAFTVNDSIFTGNQAAICILNNDNEINDDTKQKIAVEINLSETAFVSHLDGNKFYLRWFTPTTEVNLCGHATLATSCVLFRRFPNEDTLHFSIKDNKQLSASYDRGNNLISLDFPANKPDPVNIKDFPFITKILNIIVGENVDLISLQYSKTTKKLLVHLNADVTYLKSLKPDFDKLLAIKENTMITGVSVTIGGSADIDFHSRYFAPWNGINEDPVNGSSHTVLTPYWAALTNKLVLTAKQESKRGGMLVCELVGERVKLSGKCRLFVSGHLNLNG